MTDNNATQTYLALRFAMLLLAGLLFTSVAIQVLASDPLCVLHSISAYYHTAVRGVFVGALCAIGACLMAYRGSSDKENVVLDYAGFMAFIVAFVPTEFDRTCTASGAQILDDPGFAAAVENNVIAVLLIAVFAAVAAWIFPWLRPNQSDSLSPFAKGTIGVTVVLLVIGFVVFGWMRDLFLRYGHATAAILLFAGIIVVVWFNADDFADKRGGSVWWNRYAFTAIAMALTVLGCVALYLLGIEHAVLAVEALLIIEFAVFWGLQIQELRNNKVRLSVPPPAGQAPPAGESEMVATE